MADPTDPTELLRQQSSLPQPWERQRGEPRQSFHAFCHYRDILLGQSRSIDKAWRAHMTVCLKRQVPGDKRAPKLWWQWSSLWGWVQRAESHDSDLDKSARDQIVRDQIEARKRHARLMSTTQAALSAPVRAILEALQDPTVMASIVAKVKVDPLAFLQVEGLVARVAAVMPGLVTQERLALGLSTDSVVIDDRRDVDTLSARITKDPAATDMAIALLDRLAGTGEGSAFRLGTPGESGTVADGAAPEPADEEAG